MHYEKGFDIDSGFDELPWSIDELPQVAFKVVI